MSPIWLTPTAWVLYFLLLVLLIYGYKQSAVTKERFKNKLELQKLEAEKAHEIDVLKLNFFTSISHEFRTPLTLIIDPIDRLLAENATMDTSERKNYYRLLKGNAQRLLRLVNQVLDMSEIDAGCMKLAVVQLNVVEFCRMITETFAYRANQKGIKLHFSSNTTASDAFFDPDIVEKVLINLISNALKFTPNNGSVTIKLELMNQERLILPRNLTSPDLPHLRITVKDNGPGIPEAHTEKIFERFYQVENTAARKSGTGIGLALTKQLVEQHKGHISVTSKEGEGSTFCVWLPISDASYTVDEILKVNEETTNRGTEVWKKDNPLWEGNKEEEDTRTKDLLGLPVVLIVEDNDDLRKYLYYHLEKEYAVYEASDGMEGLEKAQEISPDLIISDIMMPGINGLELCKHIKSNPNTSHIPVILLTAKSSDSAEMEGLQTGADDYISKPFNMLLLKTRIKNIISMRQKIKEQLSDDPAFNPKDIATNSIDQKFFNDLLKLIEEHIADVNFNPDMLADLMRVSRSQLYKKVKGLTGLSVSILIRNIRLRKACQLLKTHSMAISEVAYEVGFSDPGYFTKCFKEMYSQPPSEYAGGRV